ncbi:hypothetical protein EBZ80_10930 [bacterium]|nr:hypothetical protein [bacterium]
MLNRNLSRVLVTLISLTAGFSSGFGLVAAVSQARGAHASAKTLSAEAVAIPEGHPVPGQEAIDHAMEIFKISRPDDAERPVFDPGLTDRGLTVKSSWLGKTQVYIGPSAFTSWGMLGSTLAHEVEVHCRQNFPVIFMRDQLGMNGTAEAEREAYRYEIQNAARFGLSGRDTKLIAATVEYYYPRGK